VLVKNRHGKIVGIISPKDLMRATIGVENPAQNMKQRLADAEKLLKTSIAEKKSIELTLEMYQQAFHETPYMMHAANEKGIILMANKREHEVLGYAEGELTGKSIFELYAKNMHKLVTSGLKEVIEKGHHHITYTTLLTKKNELYYHNHRRRATYRTNYRHQLCMDRTKAKCNGDYSQRKNGFRR
jgi:PAS domain S-box-containing protein